jgi:predicted phage terminase large subunit-like protein
VDISVSDVLKAKDKIIDALNERKRVRLSLEAERAIALHDTYYLSKYVLGYDELNNRFHRSLCRHHDTHLFDNIFILAPRKHFKTTNITISGKIRLALLRPDIAICIMADTLDNAAKFLFEIKDHHINNDKFRTLFPEHAIHKISQEGRHDRFTTPARKKTWRRSETYEIASAKKAVTSRHYDILMFDDLCDEENSKTVEWNQKVYETYAASLPITSQTPSGKPWHHIVGTRWSFDDMYGKILDDPEKRKDFYVHITQAHWMENGEIKYLFPEKYAPEWFEFMRREQGNYLYSCLFLNNPVPESEALLDPSFLNYYDPEKIQDKPFYRVMTVDPAGGGKGKKDDPTFIGIYDIDPDSNIYIRECWKDKANPEEIVQVIIDMQKAWSVRLVGVEKVSLGKWLMFYLEKAMKDSGAHFVLEPITRDSRIRKPERQKRIIPYMRNGKIHVRETEPLLEYIRRECREYHPEIEGRNDHFLDTLTDAIELLSQNLPHWPRKRARSFRTPPIVTLNKRNFQTGYLYRSGGFGQHG